MKDKKTKARPNWRKPIDEKQVINKIDQMMHIDRDVPGRCKGNISYEESSVLGFPGTTPDPIAVTVYARYLDRHTNNIGLHTTSEKAEHGFPGTQKAEREVIAMAADLMDIDFDKVDGYISPGGTEANIIGCWIGRNAHLDGLAAIICSRLTHYSIQKGANLLRIGQSFHKDGSGLHYLGTDENGHILLDDFRERLFFLASRRVQNITVVGNAGTVMLGSVDDIPAMSEIIEEAKENFLHVNIHFHIDAAFGGFIVPFIKELPKVGFSNSAVDSIGLDAHKTGLAPYGSGIFLARKGLLKRIWTDTPYFSGGDHTICGSRAGAMALSCWAVMKKMGRDGYDQNAQKLMKMTKYIQEGLRGIDVPIFEPDINLIAVKEPFPESFEERFIAHTQDDFPANLGSMSSSVKTSIWNIVVMDHIGNRLADELLSEMKKARR